MWREGGREGGRKGRRARGLGQGREDKGGRERERGKEGEVKRDMLPKQIFPAYQNHGNEDKIL